MLRAIGAVIGGIVGASITVGAAFGIAESLMNISSNLRDDEEIKKPAKNVPEYDRKVRRCIVKLITKEIEDCPVSGILNCTRHWALLFEFEDGVVRILEGLEYENAIEAFINKNRSPNHSEVYNEYEVGAIEISPYQLRFFALKNPLNGSQYYSATNNCQQWVKETAKLLGGQIGKEVDEFYTLYEINPLLALSWTGTNKSCEFVSMNVKSMNKGHVQYNY